MQTIRCRNALKGPYWIGETCIESPLPSGWLPGDQVNPETGEYKRRNKHPTLVGIIDLTNRTRYGFSSRGVPLYLFYPLDASYPPMIVGSKAPTTANQFGLAQFSGMETCKAKWPRAALQKLLGPVGNSAVELEALRFRVRVHSNQQDDSSFEYNNNEEKEQLLQQKWDFTFNIDPIGCQDIDDVISWRTNMDGSTDFAISISNVSYWVPAGSNLDKIAQQRAQTVYENGTVLYPMLPTSLSEQSASLRSDGISRPVLSLIWTIHVDGSCEKPRWSSYSLINNRTFTYESVLEEEEICKKLTWCLEKITQQTSIPYDPHIWIEIAMVTYNNHAANTLIEKGQGILRRHAGRVSQEDYSTLAEKTGCRDIAWLGASAGEYVPVQTDQTYHSGLGLSEYCHASSPLRRYADLVNQRILTSIISVDEDLSYSQLSHQLNDRSKAIKSFERDVWYLQHISPTSLTTCKGWILTIKPTNDGFFKITAYVPEWKRKVRVRITDPSKWNIGDPVSITVFCDLRRASYTDRYVFSIIDPVTSG